MKPCVTSCRQHPWFTLHLPRYLAVMQADTVASHLLIDIEMIEEVSRLGFDPGFVRESVQNRLQNKVQAWSWV